MINNRNKKQFIFKSKNHVFQPWHIYIYILILHHNRNNNNFLFFIFSALKKENLYNWLNQKQVVFCNLRGNKNNYNKTTKALFYKTCLIHLKWKDFCKGKVSFFTHVKKKKKSTFINQFYFHQLKNILKYINFYNYFL